MDLPFAVNSKFGKIRFQAKEHFYEINSIALNLLLSVTS